MQKYKPNFIFLDKACDTVKKIVALPLKSTSAILPITFRWKETARRGLWSQHPIAILIFIYLFILILFYLEEKTKAQVKDKTTLEIHGKSGLWTGALNKTQVSCP